TTRWRAVPGCRPRLMRAEAVRRNDVSSCWPIRSRLLPVCLRNRAVVGPLMATASPSHACHGGPAAGWASSRGSSGLCGSSAGAGARQGGAPRGAGGGGAGGGGRRRGGGARGGGAGGRTRGGFWGPGGRPRGTRPRWGGGGGRGGGGSLPPSPLGGRGGGGGG